MRKRALHNLPPWQAKWPCARSWSSLPSPCSLPGTWGCKSWIIVPSSLSLPEFPWHPRTWVRPEPSLTPKAVEEDQCSRDKIQSARCLAPDFGPHVNRCPLLCSLYNSPSTPPIFPAMYALKRRHLSLINETLIGSIYLVLRLFFLLLPFPSRFAVPLAPTNNWIPQDGIHLWQVLMQRERCTMSYMWMCYIWRYVLAQGDKIHESPNLVGKITLG